MPAIIIAAGKPGSVQKLRLPTAAISIDEASPEKGDELEVTLKVRVVGQTGESTEVEPLECNGQPITDSDESEESEEMDPMKVAEKADEDPEEEFGHY